MASRTDPKNSTFSGLGFRARHDGRQKTPVVRTAVQNNSSYPASASRKARIISGSLRPTVTVRT
jgi:hypothetical protein